MEIPKQVRVGRTLYAVLNKPYASRVHVGTIDYTNRLIVVGQRQPVSRRPLTRKERAHVFWHEVTHAILKDMGHRLEANEEFVDTFAKGLNNVIHSAKF